MVAGCDFQAHSPANEKALSSGLVANYLLMISESEQFNSRLLTTSDH